MSISGNTYTGGQEGLETFLGDRIHAFKGKRICLEGDLGAGKTTFTQALLKIWNYSGTVTSPTFALCHEYRMPDHVVKHVDCYRINDAAELLDMGWDEADSGIRVTWLIEWGDRLAGVVCYDGVIRFEHMRAKPEQRKITVLLAGWG